MVCAIKTVILGQQSGTMAGKPAILAKMNKRVQVYYSGRVQGVGFRFTAEAVAVKLGLSGWVKNLADGRVELVAEAKEELLNKLLLNIDQELSSYIRQKDVHWSEANGEFNAFQIRFF